MHHHALPTTCHHGAGAHGSLIHPLPASPAAYPFSSHQSLLVALFHPWHSGTTRPTHSHRCRPAVNAATCGAFSPKPAKNPPNVRPHLACRPSALVLGRENSLSGVCKHRVHPLSPVALRLVYLPSRASASCCDFLANFRPLHSHKKHGLIRPIFGPKRVSFSLHQPSPRQGPLALPKKARTSPLNFPCQPPSRVS